MCGLDAETGKVLPKENTFLLRAELAPDGQITGRLRRFSCDKAMPFYGLDQAVLMMNGWMDEQDALPADMVLRTFQNGTGEPAAAADDGQCRLPARTAAVLSRGSFLVQIVCRRHNSWQGEVCWKAQRRYFRSVLELLCLIRSALVVPAAGPVAASH